MSVQERNYLILDKFIERYGERPGGLIRVLKKAQDLFGYLSRDVQIHVAEKMCLPVGHVNGVATFYAHFVTTPPGKNIVSVCMGTACYVKNAQGVLNRFQDLLHVEPDETTADGQFTLRTTRCIGACSLAPVLTVNEDVHSYLTEEQVAGLLARYTEDTGEEVETTDQERPRLTGDQRTASPPN